MKGNNPIIIASLYDVYALISTEKNPALNIVSIRNSGESEEIQDMFDLHRDNFNSLCSVIFDDISEPMAGAGYRLPKEKDIEKVLQWAKDKENILVHCSAGISRSSAIAYLIECTRIPPCEAVKILKPGIHYPNRLMVKIGSEILGNPEIYEVFNKKNQ